MRRFTLRSARGETAGIAFGPEGPPDLVFLHATGFNALTYRTLLAPLGARWRVAALDLRGHGLSRLPADPERLDTLRVYVRDLLALWPRLVGDARPPVLGGHSLGGLVSITAAATRRGIANRLVLLDPVLQPMRFIHRFQPIDVPRDRIALLPIALGAARRRAAFPGKADALGAYRGRSIFATWRDGFLDDYVEDGFAANGAGVSLTCTPAWEAASFAALRHDAVGLLGRVRPPAVLLKAETASTVRESEARLLRRKPDLRIARIAGTTHFLPMEKPDLVRQYLHDALEARERRG